MTGVQPFQFEPTYPPGEEPTSRQKKAKERQNNWILMPESGTPNGVFVVETVQQCPWPMNVFAAKN